MTTDWGSLGHDWLVEMARATGLTHLEIINTIIDHELELENTQRVAQADIQAILAAHKSVKPVRHGRR